MIKKFIRRVFSLGSSAKTKPKTVPPGAHPIRREALSNGSRKVCEGLQQAGFAAYVVGGAVRDLLLGVKPKDFDVATDAPPEEVHRLFRRSRLIGRRFKLVHVMFGSETVEVSTFRAGDVSETDEHGRVLRDNVFGTREDDAARRDFTVNALYFDPATETILAFHNGLRDLKARSVSIIGDPVARFREDPVRMLRAARFSAKLGFTIDARTRAPIAGMAELIGNVPAARVFDEMLKLLLSGHAKPCILGLRKEGLHHGLLPMLDVILEQPMGERFVLLALDQTDQRVQIGKPVSPAFLFAALLWHEVLASWKKAQQEGQKPLPALHTAMDHVLDIQTGKLAIPRRYTTVMKDIWAMQPRFEQRSGRRPFSLLTSEKFRAGFDFLVLRAASGECEQELADWWEKFQHAEPEVRADMLKPQEVGEKRPRRKRRRRPAHADGAETATASHGDAGASAEE